MRESPENRKPDKPGKRCKATGYTMVEIMLTVGLITIIAVMAVPNLQHVRRNALETAAIQGLKELSQAEELYYDIYGYYTDGHDQVQDLRSVDAIDSKAYQRMSLRRGVFIKGYSINFRNTGTFPQNYSIIAWPLERGMDLKTFMIIGDGIVREYDDVWNRPVTIY